jgi:hypothetical protein
MALVFPICNCAKNTTPEDSKPGLPSIGWCTCAPAAAAYYVRACAVARDRGRTHRRAAHEVVVASTTRRGAKRWLHRPSGGTRVSWPCRAYMSLRYVCVVCPTSSLTAHAHAYPAAVRDVHRAIAHRCLLVWSGLVIASSSAIDRHRARLVASPSRPPAVRRCLARDVKV